MVEIPQYLHVNACHFIELSITNCCFTYLRPNRVTSPLIQNYAIITHKPPLSIPGGAQGVPHVVKSSDGCHNVQMIHPRANI